MLAQEWARAMRSGQSLGLIMLDVDHFKLFNDHYGHPAGDECLRLVAAELQRHVSGPGDLVARWGGEEFVLVLADSIQLADSPQFATAMENFRRVFHEPYYRDYISDDIEGHLKALRMLGHPYTDEDVAGAKQQLVRGNLSLRRIVAERHQHQAGDAHGRSFR